MEAHISVGNALVLALFVVRAFTAPAYTDNLVCRQNMCVNPLFPGLNDMSTLETIIWECATESAVKPFLDFCKDVIHYDAALPSPTGAGQGIDKVVKSQDNAASTMFFYHLNAMGYEAWEHASPGNSSDPCVRSVWQLGCYTYFPKAQAGCKVGESTPYYRPCKNTCEHYLQACQVECCDESPQCVYQESHKNASDVLVSTSGYVDADGPSAICTGHLLQLSAKSGAHAIRSSFLLIFMLFGLQSAYGSDEGAGARTARPSASRVVLTVALVITALCLQGCTGSIEHHATGNWQQKPNYLAGFGVLPPGNATVVLNSCSTPGVLKCSGHGVCKTWSRVTRVSSVDGDSSALSFCQCEPEWADPECRTARKSQMKAFILSLFGGYLGADYFYLGYSSLAILKAMTLGGCGFWWLLDVVRTGAGPIYASEYRTSPDLPHFVFVAVTVVLFLVLGFFLSVESYLGYRRNKREELMKLQQSEECRRLNKLDDIEGPNFKLPSRTTGFESSRNFSGYGSMLPMPLPNAGAPLNASYLPAAVSGRPLF